VKEYNFIENWLATLNYCSNQDFFQVL